MSRSGLEWDKKSGLLIRERTGEVIAKGIGNKLHRTYEVVRVNHIDKKHKPKKRKAKLQEVR